MIIVAVIKEFGFWDTSSECLKRSLHLCCCLYMQQGQDKTLPTTFAMKVLLDEPTQACSAFAGAFLITYNYLRSGRAKARKLFRSSSKKRPKQFPLHDCLDDQLAGGSLWGGSRFGGLPKLGVPFLGVPIITIIIFRGLY